MRARGCRHTLRGPIELHSKLSKQAHHNFMEVTSTKSKAIAGAFAGAVARLLTAPFDVIKIRYQLQSNVNKKYTSIWQAFTSIVKEEGPLSLWKGNISATYLWISYSMIQFSCYGLLKAYGDALLDSASGSQKEPLSRVSTGTGASRDRKSASGQHSSFRKTFVLFAAGACAGMIATASTYPFDIIRTQFALQVGLFAFMFNTL